jgi:hypothetical protein
MPTLNLAASPVISESCGPSRACSWLYEANHLLR